MLLSEKQEKMFLPGLPEALALNPQGSTAKGRAEQKRKMEAFKQSGEVTSCDSQQVSEGCQQKQEGLFIWSH